MVQKTKFEIIGPYTPEHEGPFCTRDGKPVDLKMRDGRGVYPLAGYIGEGTSVHLWTARGAFCSLHTDESPDDLMNAREVPVAREFWLNEFKGGDGYVGVSHAHDTELKAINERHERENWNWTRTIHVREVLPGEDE